MGHGLFSFWFSTVLATGILIWLFFGNPFDPNDEPPIDSVMLIGGFQSTEISDITLEQTETEYTIETSGLETDLNLDILEVDFDLEI